MSVEVFSTYKHIAKGAMRLSSLLNVLRLGGPREGVLVQRQSDPKFPFPASIPDQMRRSYLKVLSSEMDPAEIRLIL